MHGSYVQNGIYYMKLNQTIKQLANERGKCNLFPSYVIKLHLVKLSINVEVTHI